MDVLVYVDRTDSGEIVWWAESDDQPGFTASAPSLHELKDVVSEVATTESWGEPSYTLSAPEDPEQALGGVQPEEGAAPDTTELRACAA